MYTLRAREQLALTHTCVYVNNTCTCTHRRTLSQRDAAGGGAPLGRCALLGADDQVAAAQAAREDGRAARRARQAPPVPRARRGGARTGEGRASSALTSP